MNHTSAIRAPALGRSHGTKDRWQSWLDWLGACACAGLIALTWTQHFNASPQSEDALSFSYLWTILVTGFLGASGFALTWNALASAHRAGSLDGHRYQTWALYLLAGFLMAVSLVGLGTGIYDMQSHPVRVDNRAFVGAIDPSGVRNIQFQSATYYNRNNQCDIRSADSSPFSRECGRGSSPPVRTQSWLIAHNQWPLTRVGEVTYSELSGLGKGVAGFGTPDSIYPVLRPTAHLQPATLFIQTGAGYVEFQRRT